MDRARAAFRLSTTVTADTVVQRGGNVPRDFATLHDEPLVQRPAGSTGKDGVCELVFGASTRGTVLRRSFVTHPFHLTAPWRLDPTLPQMAVVYVQTPAGGLIQGDRTRLQLVGGRGTQIHLTTQAAEKIHSMTANYAEQRVSLRLQADAYLEYCPEPIILFPGARFAQNLDITLEPDAGLFLTEIYLARRAPDGSVFDAFSSRMRVRTDGGELLLHERSFVVPRPRGLDGPGCLDGHPVWGQALFLGAEASVAWVRDLHDLLASVAGIVGGATLPPRGSGFVVKVVGADMRVVREALYRVWNYVRERRFGAPAPVFPK